jgi:hypothetical protein
MINQDESIPETADGEAIAKSNIHMNHVKVFIFSMVDWTTAVGFTDHCILTQGRREFPAIHPLAITANLKRP